MQTNNYLKFINTLKEIKGTPTLLLHACCAPCSTFCLERLVDYFDITLYFYNPNITIEEEFEKRYIELETFINKVYKDKVKIIKEPYDSSVFYTAVQGLENEPERGKRCKVCYDLRLRKTAEFGVKNGYDYFATTLTLSPHKNATWLNEIGESLSSEYFIKYLNSDFKKEGGYLRSIELSKKYDLYRQDYCGCGFSRDKRR